MTRPSISTPSARSQRRPLCGLPAVAPASVPVLFNGSQDPIRPRNSTSGLAGPGAKQKEPARRPALQQIDAEGELREEFRTASSPSPSSPLTSQSLFKQPACDKQFSSPTPR